MKSIVSLVMAGMAVFALSGCGGDGSGDDLGGSSLVKDYAQNRSNTMYDSSINLLNDTDSSENICEVYSAPQSSDNWSKLTGTPIVPGEVHEWGSNHCNQHWDLKVVDCVSNESTITYYRKCGTTTYFTFKNW